MPDWDKDYRSASMVGRNPEIVRDAANAEIERLKAALREIENMPDQGPYGCVEDMRDAARAALEGKDAQEA